MKKSNFIEINMTHLLKGVIFNRWMIYILIFSTIYISEALAVTDEYVPTIHEVRTYSDGDYNYEFTIDNFPDKSAFNTWIYKYDQEGNQISSYNRHLHYGLNGEPLITDGSSHGRPVLNFNQDGVFIGVSSGELPVISNTIKDDNGDIVMYDGSSNIVGVYSDVVDFIAQELINRRQSGNVNNSLVSEDGNYYAKDKHGNVVSIYYNDGSIDKNKYSYKYDGAGNLVEKYENGKLTYAKTIYTPAEAAAATKAKGNTVSITW